MNLEDKIISAIRKINADAEVTLSITPDKSWSIEWLNGTAEISKSDIEAQFSNVETDETQKVTDKTNAVNKLKALGLTDNEIGALKI
jgi:hypothetical protein|tara:strand:+ start:264 stop:524 length:261 start_codon:yes stop_codon:yes gene_type:complete